MIFLLTGVAAVATVAGAGLLARRVMLAGCLVLFAGTAITFAAIAAATAVTFLAGTAVAGVGFGLAFLGAFRMVSALAPPSNRAGLVAAIFIVNFLAFSIPALIAGWADTRYGLHRTALVYCAFVAVLAAAAAGGLIAGRLARRTSTTNQAGAGVDDIDPDGRRQSSSPAANESWPGTMSQASDGSGGRI